MTKEAMKLALEALESVTKHFTRAQSTLRDSEVRGEAHKAITALREALAQQDECQHGVTDGCKECYMAETQQEPVAWWHQKSDTFTSGSLVSNFVEWVPLYTSPPARKPLTDEEIDRMTRGNNYPGTVQGAKRFARAIEAAHGIKGDA